MHNKSLVRDETLRYVNLVREASGANSINSLPAGTQRSSSDCAIARALKEVNQNVLVFKDVIQVEDKEFAKIIARNFGYTNKSIGFDSNEHMYCVPMPLAMSLFVDNFDEGCYEELVAV